MRFALWLFASGLDQVLDDWATDINNLLTPYQPNSVAYPNAAPTAGQIVQTLVSGGKPLQLGVTTRVENGQAQVNVYAMKPERVQVTSDNEGPSALDGHGNGYFLVARTQKQFCIEIWVATREERAPLANILFGRYGIDYDLVHVDGTTTKILYTAQVDDDEEQIHTLYVRRFFFDVDFTVTQLFPTTTVTTLVFPAETGLVSSSSQIPPTESGTTL